jgi:hypothetical protein
MKYLPQINFANLSFNRSTARYDFNGNNYSSMNNCIYS